MPVQSASVDSVGTVSMRFRVVEVEENDLDDRAQGAVSGCKEDDLSHFNWTLDECGSFEYTIEELRYPS